MTPVLHLQEPVTLAVPKNNPLANRTDITQEKLLAHNDLFLLLRWWQITPIHIARLTTRAKAVADVPMDTGRFLLRSGIGIGFFTKMVILPDVEAGHVVEVPVLDLPPVHRDTALVYLTRHSVLSKPAVKFVQQLKLEAQKQTLFAEGRVD